MQIKVMSFNIRYSASPQQDGKNSWEHRRCYVCDLLRFYRPEICGLQEVLRHQLEDISSTLPEYAFVGVGRDDGQEAGEYAPIFYFRDRFALLNSGHFWLSGQPQEPGLKGWDAVDPRMATWALLSCRSNNRSILALNTHFDHCGIQARHNSSKLLLRTLGEITGQEEIPVFVTGDFNAEPGEDCIRELLCSDIPLQSASEQSPFCYGPRWTYHEFGQLPCSERPQIDYIFMRNITEIISYASLSESRCGLYPSDHNPILLTAVL